MRLTPGLLLSLAKNIRVLPFYMRLTWRLIKDERVPFKLKLVPAASLLYLIFPLDIIKEIMMPVIGYLDDIIILFFAVRFFISKCPPEVVSEHVLKLKT